MPETVCVFCESCGSSCEIVFDREDELQNVIFCPFCGEASLDEELLDEEEIDEEDLEDDEEEDDDEEE
jgi:hypothetical protein